MTVPLRARAQKWAIILTIFFGVPGLLIWLFMPYLDYTRAGYLASRHDYLSAIRILDRAIQINGNFEPAYARRAWVYSRLGVHDKAVADFDTAIKLNPNDWQVYNNLAWIEYRAGNLEAALKNIEIAINNSDDSPYPYDTRAVILMSQHKNDLALRDLNNALRLNPAYGAAYFHRAQLYKELGDLAAAEHDAQTATELGYLHD